MQLDDLFREEASDVDEESVDNGHAGHCRQRVSSTNSPDHGDPGPMPAAGPSSSPSQSLGVSSDPRCRSVVPGRQEVTNDDNTRQRRKHRKRYRLVLRD